MKKYLILTFIVTIGFSCGKIIFREVKCSPIIFDLEQYFGPENLNQNISLKNQQTAQVIRYQIKDKSITFTEKYISDSGCGCDEQSGILAVNSQDSVYILQKSNYVEKNKPQTRETVVWENGPFQSFFYETNLSTETSFTYKNIVYTDVKIYKKPETIAQKAKMIILKKGIGILYIETVNGDVWLNTNPDIKVNTLANFKVDTTTCK